MAENMVAAQTALETAVYFQPFRQWVVVGKSGNVSMMQTMGKLAQASTGNYVDVTPQMKGQSLENNTQEVPPSQRPPKIERHGKYISGRKT